MIQFDDFRDYKQVFLTGLIQTSDECIRASDSRPRRSHWILIGLVTAGELRDAVKPMISSRRKYD